MVNRDGSEVRARHTPWALPGKRRERGEREKGEMRGERGLESREGEEMREMKWKIQRWEWRGRGGKE